MGIRALTLWQPWASFLTDCLLMSNQPTKLCNENAGEIAIAGMQPLELAVGVWKPGNRLETRKYPAHCLSNSG